MIWSLLFCVVCAKMMSFAQTLFYYFSCCGINKALKIKMISRGGKLESKLSNFELMCAEAHRRYKNEKNMDILGCGDNHYAFGM